jgi:hypothetical protein
LDERLMEGIHYSIMFYGGALLRNLTPQDLAVEEFVALPRINRNFAVVIDSDRTSRGTRINATKSRVRSEIEGCGENGVAWVTRGYTIENYVPVDLLQGAVTAAHPSATCTWNGDAYTNPLAADQIRGRQSDVDKSKVASAVVAAWTDDVVWPHDLRASVARIVAMLQRANDLS